MTDNLKPIRDIISESKIKIKSEIEILQDKLKDFGFSEVNINIQKKYFSDHAGNRTGEFIITIKPVLCNYSAKRAERK